ncbi:hypothetical protein Pelo_19464 [Pelomyxa schiedti]|nr:hypothetical protein Pelo_19464 [Pelomyxa schiedti]
MCVPGVRTDLDLFVAAAESGFIFTADGHKLRVIEASSGVVVLLLPLPEIRGLDGDGCEVFSRHDRYQYWFLIVNIWWRVGSSHRPNRRAGVCRPPALRITAGCRSQAGPRRRRLPRAQAPVVVRRRHRHALRVRGDAQPHRAAGGAVPVPFLLGVPGAAGGDQGPGAAAAAAPPPPAARWPRGPRTRGPGGVGGPHAVGGGGVGTAR